MYLLVTVGVGAPTVLWCGNDGRDGGDGGSGGRLVAVPAVTGRVLSFDGTLLHAVPCPNGEWLHEGHERHQRGHQRKGAEEVERVVTILNCWDDHAPFVIDGSSQIGPKGHGADMTEGDPLLSPAAQQALLHDTIGE